MASFETVCRVWGGWFPGSSYLCTEEEPAEPGLMARPPRTAGVDDRVVELKRPLGIVLNEDKSGNVYVETVAARGNAARTGLVSP